MLARFESTDQLRLAQELIAAQTYLRARGLEIDLVFLIEEPAGTKKHSGSELLELVRADGGSIGLTSLAAFSCSKRP